MALLLLPLLLTVLIVSMYFGCRLIASGDDDVGDDGDDDSDVLAFVFRNIDAKNLSISSA